MHKFYFLTQPMSTAYAWKNTPRLYQVDKINYTVTSVKCIEFFVKIFVFSVIYIYISSGENIEEAQI